jgi:hypothetical protein
VRNRWGLTAEAYIENGTFSRSFLDEDQTRLAHEVMSGGTYFQKATLNWCLENLVPLKYRQSEVIVITYEELVLLPNDMISLLSRQFDLTHVQDMLGRIRIPTQEHLSEEKTRRAIQEGERDYLISRWREEVSDEQLKDAGKILAAFGISEYRLNEPMPETHLLYFASRPVRNAPIRPL